MLNRTNRTLSANSNRLNLGTRSLAPVAGLDTVTQTLRVRHAHPSKRKDFARDGAYPIDPAIIDADPIPMAPSPAPDPAWPFAAARAGARVMVVAEAPPVERQVVTTDPSRRTGWSRGQGQAWPRSERPEGSCRLGRTAPASKRGRTALAAAMCRMTAAPDATLAVAWGG